ncbi:MAG: autotransporter-associated beta strand repeat-containing protein [Verrucomicrobiota bacterium]
MKLKSNPFVRSFHHVSAAISVVFSIAGICTQSAHAATQTWDGEAGNQDWNTATNWTTNAFPSQPGAAIINTVGGTSPIISANSAFTPNDIIVGQGTSGLLTQTAGTAQTGSGNWMIVGQNAGGNGTYNISGGVMNTTELHIAAATSAGNTVTGAVTVSGAGQINTAGWFSLADAGNATTTANATLTVSADATGTSATPNVAVGGHLVVASAGNGTGILNLNGGTIKMTGSDQSVDVNRYDTAKGQLTVNGGTLDLQTNNDIFFSRDSGTGTSFVTLTSGAITGGSGSLINMMYSNVAGNNTVNLNGGTLTIGQIMTGFAAGTRNFTFNGGTLKAATGANSNFFAAGTASTATVNSLGGTIDNNGNNITIGQVFGGTGGLKFTGAGTGVTTLTGANTYAGATIIDGGTLLGNTSNTAANGSLSSTSGITINTGGTLSATENGLFGHGGTAEKGITVNAGGTLRTNAAGVNVNVGVVTLNGGIMTNAGSAANSVAWGSFAFRHAGDRLLVTDNSTVSALDVHMRSGAYIEVSTGKNLDFTGTLINADGVGALVKNGDGTLKLTGSNTYTGATTINAGFLQLGNGGTTGSLSASSVITNNGNLTINRSNAVVQGTAFSSAAITGTGSFTQAGGGTTTLNVANTFQGATSVTGGTLLLSGSGAINSSSGITINGSGAKFVQTGSTASTPAITLTQGTLDGTTTVGAVTVGAGTGGIVGNGNGGTGVLTLGSLTFSGAGGLNLNLADATAGGLAVTGAVTTGANNTVTVNIVNLLTLGTTYNLVSSPDFTGSDLTDYIYGGNTARKTGTFDYAGGFLNLTVNGDTPKWTGGDNGNWVVGITGINKNWNLITAGTATDYINNDDVLFDDSATGPTTINISGGVVNPNSVVFNNSSLVYTIGGSGIGDGTASTSLVKNGTAKVTLTNSNSYTGQTIINAGTLELGDGTSGNDGTISGTSGVTNNGTLTFNRFGAGNTAAYAIGGTGAVVKNGAGNQTLSGVNTYGGATMLNSGTLTAGSTTAFGATASTLTITGGSLDSSVANLVLANNNAQAWNGDFAFTGTQSLNLGTGAVTLGGNRVITANANTLTVGGVIGGDYGLTKSGAGTLNLSGANTFTGATAVNDGLLHAIGTNQQNSGILSSGSGITVNNGGSLSSTENGLFGWGGAGEKSITVNAGGIITAGTGVNVNVGLVTLNGGTMTNSGAAATWGSWTFRHAGDKLLVTENSTVSAQNVFMKGGATIEVATGMNLNFTGTLTNAASDGAGVVVKYGDGTLTLAGANTFSGGLNINAGTVSVSTQANFGATGNDVTLDSGTLKTTFTTWWGDMTRDLIVGAGGGTLNIAGQGTGTGDQGRVVFWSGASGALTGTGNLTVTGDGDLDDATGTGVLVLVGDYTNFTGNMNLDQGATLEWASANAISTGSTLSVGTNSQITVANGLTLNREITVTGAGSVLAFNNSSTGAYAGNIVLNNDVTFGLRNWYNYTQASSGSVSGSISGIGGIITSRGTSAGTPILTLTGVNTYQGNTTIGTGTTLTIGGAGQLGSGSYAADIANEGILNYASSANQTLSGDIIGSGTLTKAGGSTLTLSGTNTYTGATTVNGGKLVLDSSITSSVTVNNTATLSGQGGITGNVTVNSGGTHAIGNSPGEQTVTGDVTYGAGSIFSWDLAGNLDGDSLDGDTGTRGITYDALNVTGNMSIDAAAIFHVVLNDGADFGDGFWSNDQQWTDIFSVSGGALTSGWVNSVAIVYNSVGGIVDTGTIYGKQFTVNGTNLTWSAVPEPSSALAGLLIGAGLLRRRRR